MVFRTTSPRQNARPGFTLIELLVVIAIISLLAAILFAAFSRARENARKTSCMSNMKQLQIAVMQYSQIYDETMPLVFADFAPMNNTWEPANGEKSWMEALQPTLKSTQVFKCPSENSVATTNAATSGSDYAYNRALAYMNATTPGPRILAEITRSETTILFMEGASGDSSNNAPATLNRSGPMTGANAFADTKLQRHSGGSNLAFVDGHTKWYPAISDTESDKIMGPNTTYAASGDNPTLHGSDEVTF